MGKKPGSGIRIRDGQPGSYFIELNHIFGFKYLNSLMQIRDPEWEKIGSGIRNPGWKKFGSGTKSRIRNTA
jgi:hypothetical protein